MTTRWSRSSVLDDELKIQPDSPRFLESGLRGWENANGKENQQGEAIP